eukprot:331485_1
MGFNENLALNAAKKYPKSTDEAINWINHNQSTHQNDCNSRTIQYQNHIMRSDIINQLLSFNYTKKQIYKAMNHAKNPNDINEVMHYINHSRHSYIMREQKHDDNIFVNNCNGYNMPECISLRRITSLLIFYRNFDIHTGHDALINYLHNNEGIHLVNDYHHLLDQHLNEDNINSINCDKEFERIYNKMINNKNNNLKCDISKCEIYTRNNRQRETKLFDNINDDDLCFYVDLIDSIHCYMLHSVDSGYKIIYHPNDTKIDDDNEHICVDKEIERVKLHLKSKREKLKNTGAFNRINNHKFVTDISSENTDDKYINKNQQDAKTNSDNKEPGVQHSEYSFGENFSYWYANSVFMTHMQHKPKYKSIKEEITTNAAYRVAIHAFDQAMYKANTLQERSIRIKQIKSTTNYIYDQYMEPTINVSSILSLVLYTDYDSLSYNFSKTFRKINCNETISDVRNRNREFFHWSKTLIETVNCYGTEISTSNVSVFYHGVSFMYFPSFVAIFNAPTSTTTKLSVATIFAKHDGIILELTQPSSKSTIKFFNCSFVSNFGNEEERLFIHPFKGYRTLHFNSIRNVSTDENYKYFIAPLVNFHLMLYGSTVVMSTEHVSIISSLINNFKKKNADNIYPKYILQCFKKWIEATTQLSLNTQYLSLLISPVPQLPAFYEINQLFKNVIAIFVINIYEITSEYLSAFSIMLQRINDLEFSKLTFIQLGKIRYLPANFAFHVEKWTTKVEKGVGYSHLTMKRVDRR